VLFSVTTRRATRARKLTNACPSEGTVGPWREWIETMLTSDGRCCSKAARSGALTDVCPETTALTLVAVRE
jgi:hypothetical protein